MPKAVLKGAGYVLIHAPDMVLRNGTTQTTERIVNPQSDYLKELPGSLRSFEKAVSYPPNQVFIGSMGPDALDAAELPWHGKEIPDASRFGRFGEIMPEDELIGLMRIVDTFELVRLTADFAAVAAEKLSKHPLLAGFCGSVGPGQPTAEVEGMIREACAEGLYADGRLVGCVRRAHEIDENLSAHIMLENLASKASAVLAFLNLLSKNGIEPGEIEYVIECSEEACGDMNQRGGGNFAKSVAEIAGASNATGSDVRGFCAAPVHAIIEAASLVRAGTFNNVVVVAGGSVAKLGMNGKDHVKKGVPILEDVLAGFAALIAKNDGISPELNTDAVGRHTVGTGSAPQAVISSLVTAPLDKAGIKITDIDKFAPELQNPDITKPAGAGNVPEANYKMIAALAAMRKEIERADIEAFIAKHGMAGYAPTQGHIPSGVPFLGFAREGLTSGSLRRVMIIGKGSLFLGRMTNLFDGVSIMLERNNGGNAEEPPEAAAGDGKAGIAANTVNAVNVSHPANASNAANAACAVGLTTYGSEHGPGVLFEGAALAGARNPGIKVVLIGERAPSDAALPPNVEVIETMERDMHGKMEELLDAGYIGACVTAHYNFPIGVATVGRAVTPGFGREVYLATTTGTASADRVEAMVRGAICGIAAAKACAASAPRASCLKPTVGVLNLDGAMNAINALAALKAGGYGIEFSSSHRADGGSALRGNDLLAGNADVMVADSLTGNIIMKILSSFTTGGNYESSGSGYGPGLGEGYRRLILILSRASGSPVAANAIEYAASLARGNVMAVLKDEYEKARKAGLDGIIASLKKTPPPEASARIPDREAVTAEIPGIDVMSLEDAVSMLHGEGVYAESGMGCTGPVILVSEDKRDLAREKLKNAGYVM